MTESTMSEIGSSANAVWGAAAASAIASPVIKKTLLALIFFNSKVRTVSARESVPGSVNRNPSDNLASGLRRSSLNARRRLCVRLFFLYG